MKRLLCAVFLAAGLGMALHAAGSTLPDLGPLPSLAGASAWLNTPPLDTARLRGKVVLVDFWTYSCINCIRTLPHLRAWAEKYRDHGLVVVGVHTPEFDFEKDKANIAKALTHLKIDYPVAIDSERKVWKTFHNNGWPVFYFADAQGRVRARMVGEGGYEKAEAIIRTLLAEAGKPAASDALASAQGTAEQAAPDLAHLRSGETYIGSAQSSNRERWSLTGDWTVGPERANLNRAGGGISYRFHARDLHLVLGPRSAGTPVRFRVTLDGHAPGPDHGADTDADGNGTVGEARLYQLVRQSGEVRERTFEIRFLDAGVDAFAFTFG